MVNRLAWSAVRMLSLALLLGALVGGPARASAPADDPHVVALLKAREAAEGHLDKVDYLQAAIVVIESLRSLPPERTDLADAAYGNVLLAEFIMQYLMQYPVLTTLVEKHVDEERYPTDKYVVNLYHIFLGLDTEGKTAALREMQMQTGPRDEHALVRVMALFSMSDPYFVFPSIQLADQHVEILAEEYPDLLLTQTARNFRLYQNHKKYGLAAWPVEKSLERSADEPNFTSWNANLRQRIQSTRDALSADVKGVRKADPLCEGMKKASDWRERTFCLMFAKENKELADETELLDAAQVLATRTDRTPDVLMARMLLTRRHGKRVEKGEEGALEDCLYWADELLKSSVGEITPERTLWEDRVRAIFDAAVSLKKAGYEKESERLAKALIDEYPGSLIADHCNAFLAGTVSGE